MKHVHISKLIKFARKNKKLSQTVVAKKLGYDSCQFISNVERGECLFPVPEFKKLAKILGINSKTLLDGYLADVKDWAIKEMK